MSEKRKKKFKLFDLNRDGPGVSKDEKPLLQAFFKGSLHQLSDASALAYTFGGTVFVYNGPHHAFAGRSNL